ncbi:MAG: divalent-cation tolerance protein CutA [Gammaproteobacteria bacterium]
MNPADSEQLLVFCTCPDAGTAGQIATALVERRLAACVNRLGQVGSTYRWQGAVEGAEEVLLLIKTSRAAYADLEQAIVELHPYELPEIVGIDIDTGLPGYLDWVTKCTEPGSTTG